MVLYLNYLKCDVSIPVNVTDRYPSRLIFRSIFFWKTMDAFLGKMLDSMADAGAPVPIALQTATDGYDGMPKRPGGVLVGHVVLKGAQLGSVLGCIGGAAAGAWLKLPVFKQSASWAGRGFLLGATAMAAKMTDGKDARGALLTADGVTDRGYRIAHNEKVHFADCVSGAGALAGLVATKFKPGGAAVGLALGVLSSPVLWKYAYKPGGWANW